MTAHPSLVNLADVDLVCDECLAVRPATELLAGLVPDPAPMFALVRPWPTHCSQPMRARNRTDRHGRPL